MQSAFSSAVFTIEFNKKKKERKLKGCLYKSKGHARFLIEILLSSRPPTSLSLPLNWIDQQCRAHPIRKCLRDRGRCFRPEQHLSAKTSLWKSKAQHFDLKSCQGNAAFLRSEVLMGLIRFHGCDRSTSNSFKTMATVCFWNPKLGLIKISHSIHLWNDIYTAEC